LFVKFTVKVFDMPTVTDHPVMSARKDAIWAGVHAAPPGMLRCLTVRTIGDALVGPASCQCVALRGPGLRSEVLASPATRLDHGLRCIWLRRLSGGAE
jgi:hypothetical protein